ncbi:MAG: ABC transporter permease [Alphaproteobacteria bacterium]|nr:ABC transporter permease [Alphaproteobacteria bacterium]
MNYFGSILLLLDSTVRFSIPLMLAALAGMFAERSGVIDIGLEGKMLAAAFVAASLSAVTHNVWIGLLGGISISILLSLIHAYACVSFNGNQIVSGVALNILVAGLAPTLSNAWFGLAGQTPQLSGDARFSHVIFPSLESIGQIPIIGAIYAVLVNDHYPLTYITFLSIPLIWWLLFHTSFGLQLRAAGENPHALDSSGISVTKIRYQAMIICGILCGMAGAYLSTAQSSAFVRDMTAGKGYLALAALIFGRWNPFATVAACLIFAFADALQIRLQGFDIPGLGPIPVQLIQILPYVLTILVLAGFVGKAIPPKASGIPFVKDR